MTDANIVRLPSPEQARPVRPPSAPHGARDETTYMRLDREFYEALMADEPDLDTIARLRRALRHDHYDAQVTHEAKEPRTEAEKETGRLAALKHEIDRSGYRVSAKPFLHADRWWEPGYLDWDGEEPGDRQNMAALALARELVRDARGSLRAEEHGNEAARMPAGLRRERASRTR